MKKRISIAAGLAVAGACLWLGARGGGMEDLRRDRQKMANSSGSMASADVHGHTPVLKTKSAVRETGGPRATHGPERLKEFYLPAVDIEGLSLREALGRLMAAYEDACGKAGEVPIRLTFDVPPGATRKLRLVLAPGNFNSSIRLLATYAGMKVTRDKTAYRFEPFADERGQVKRSISVPPDFATRLSDRTGPPSGPESEPPFEENNDPAPNDTRFTLPIAEVIKRSGMELDPSTRLSLKPSGELALETSSGADAAMISALAEALGNDVPVQHRFNTKVIHITGVPDWTPPDISQMTDPEVQLLMRELTQKKGVDLLTLPSVTGRNRQSAKVEKLNEVIYPVNDEETVFETQNVGVTMRVEAGALAFGHDVDFKFTASQAVGYDHTNRKPVISQHAVSSSGYTSDGNTKFAVETQPDGSRVLVLLSTTMTDATGRPLHGAE